MSSASQGTELRCVNVPTCCKLKHEERSSHCRSVRSRYVVIPELTACETRQIRVEGCGLRPETLVASA